ncbi:hypothetical protein CC85DRAFT_38487 [Cutaneotrichosporon oleaginosum]|uniref:Arrestin-like N-terminal domain-containing protein n=1 Tax=Cutaneotrichosporon oleaginosum TaxID=879819 RepID=A0A0J0XB99_9TREE|nr:uncharacterized protein CC85DRAFT_38487 [Cutaneotrichosporon oleaginosum]KLT38325.1 hypothetical protein CC85DRAFT_38487 [Cutaneotrichosporon oleaginosum]TXT12577.1 hypothetical protein COLE_02987 [Cutaneotrichosporon oleaginosum]
MLQALLVQVQPKQGNIASKNFPVVGYFGVTPVVLAGTVHVKVEEGGPKIPIRSVQVAVRCYESRDSMRSTRRDHVIYEKTKHIWHPPAGVQDEVLDGWEQPFKLSIPPEAAELARGTQNLREWRVRWRLEVMVEHVPIPHVGHRVAHAYDINVYDHRSPSPSLPSPPAGMVLGSGATATHVHINPPPTAFGPSESLNVSFSVRPDDPSTSVKKLQLILERRVELLDGRRPVGGSTDDLPTPRRSRVHNLFRGSSPLSNRGTSEKPERVIVTRIADALCEVPPPGPNGAVWSMGSLQLPRRGHNWAVGETTRTHLADISFEARVKITVKNKHELPRARLKREHSSEPSPAIPRRRLQLPSLDALGLRLPKVKEERPLRDRPATAPSFGVYAAKPPPFGSRPQTSAGFAFIMPAPRR